MKKLFYIFVVNVSLLVPGYIFGGGHYVGNYYFSDQDAIWSNQIIRLSYPKAKPDAGTRRMIRALQKLQVLENNGRSVSSEELEREAARMERTTLRPERLRQIQEIFGSDQEAYLRVYVLPAYVERILPFEFFPNTPSIQEDRKAEVYEILQEVLRNPSSLRRMAKKRNLEVETLEVSWKKVVKQGKKARQYEVDGKAAFWMRFVVPHLQNGQVFKKAIEADTGWYIVRYLGKIKERKHRMEYVFFPKKDYGSWLEDQIQSIHVQAQ